MSWVREHPWMTFFLASGAISTVGMIARGREGGLGTMLDPSPGPRPRVPGPSVSRIREIRAQRERERQYREYADYARTYGAPQLVGFSHFAGLSAACQCEGKPCARMGMGMGMRALAATAEPSVFKPALVALGFGLGVLYLVRRM